MSVSSSFSSLTSGGFAPLCLQYWVDVTAMDAKSNIVRCGDRPGEAVNFGATGTTLSDVATWCSGDYYRVTFIPHAIGSKTITVTYRSVQVGSTTITANFDPGLFEYPSLLLPIRFSSPTHFVPAICPFVSDMPPRPQVPSPLTTARSPHGQSH